jgi:hypothetical protein
MLKEHNQCSLDSGVDPELVGATNREPYDGGVDVIAGIAKDATGDSALEEAEGDLSLS